MLRPATPLAVLLFIAFVLLLLSVLSAPIVKAIPLASFQGVDYGVFGFCDNAVCSGIQVGYKQSTTTGQWKLGSFDGTFTLKTSYLLLIRTHS